MVESFFWEERGANPLLTRNCDGPTYTGSEPDLPCDIADAIYGHRISKRQQRTRGPGGEYRGTR
jgi:hypothetical protein